MVFLTFVLQFDALATSFFLRNFKQNNYENGFRLTLLKSISRFETKSVISDFRDDG